MLVYPLDRAGYARLCRLLTLGKGRAGKDGCDLGWEDLARSAEGLLAILLPDARTIASRRSYDAFVCRSQAAATCP